MEILIKLLLAVLGIALYTVFKAREYIFTNDKPFYWDVFISENFKSWIWSLAVIVIVLTIISIEPESSEVIKSFTGIDLDNTSLGFLTFGIFLTGFTKNTTE